MALGERLRDLDDRVLGRSKGALSTVRDGDEISPQRMGWQDVFLSTAFGLGALLLWRWMTGHWGSGYLIGALVGGTLAQVARLRSRQREG